MERGRRFAVHDEVRPARGAKGRSLGVRALVLLSAMACGVTVATTLAAAAKPAAGATSAPAPTAAAPLVTPGNSISEAAGFPQSDEANGIASPGLTQFFISPQRVGDLVVLSMQVHTTSVSINTVSGGNVSNWTPAESYNGTTDPLHFEVWWGVVTSTGSSKVTITYAGPAASWPIELIADSFTSGSSVPWVKVRADGFSNPSGTSAQFPLLPADPTRTKSTGEPRRRRAVQQEAARQALLTT